LSYDGQKVRACTIQNKNPLKIKDFEKKGKRKKKEEDENEEEEVCINHQTTNPCNFIGNSCLYTCISFF